MLRIRYTDIFRATLAASTGNEGWIGISRKGDAYHVVVPVDVQTARGVLACNRPSDGTPFGGYAGWLYFPCPTYDKDGASGMDEKLLRVRRTLQTAEAVVALLASNEIDAVVEHDRIEPCDAVSSGNSIAAVDAHIEEAPRESASNQCRIARCEGCEESWTSLRELLADSHVKLTGYRACVDDFPKGVYLFSHVCGGNIEIPVSRFGRSRLKGRSLAGTHACPGMCYYETSMAACSAECDGALYRRLARRLLAGAKSARVR